MGRRREKGGVINNWDTTIHHHHHDLHPEHHRDPSCLRKDLSTTSIPSITEDLPSIPSITEQITFDIFIPTITIFIPSSGEQKTTYFRKAIHRGRS